ncbi:AbrB/MazE/SpoVT family DNA-binding domain-containing protein [Ruminiclostridium cellobioparum]|jgi:transcriptional pleiotropic regulator of transition state genes|uniref:Looped-hinge helix DNA binding domain, AbrB family n=1 Tax=Ruminiclostridium cellobioparum subsp. termitidis CT1112 TaxID=1195236 RepID=S0FMI6_RUMCE|nr:AbrB/MazE/SpoVT family DNA-binding domain-containing protein [Ruminiclostridium cellobioparum]EMS71556.1 looped-hinge helix DNA binding domain, AbrB family [Ruminiclostridium cellobioparum subsp. termitidis CT1112]
MKSTGIVRKTDCLNRVVIPKELCREYDIDEGTPIEIFVDEGKIILTKYLRGCTFCGELKNLTYFQGKPICAKCREDINNR